MDFANSSHQRHWIFTRDQLAEFRRRAQEQCCTAVVRQLQGAADPSQPEEGSATKKARKDLSSPISPEDELKLLRYYEDSCQQMCKALKLPTKVMCTALMYMKRFFLTNSMVEYEPGRTMMTALFLATKTEEHYTPAHKLATEAKIKEELVVKAEVAMLEALRFELVVHSPYRALAGLLQEVRAARAEAQTGSSSGGLPPLDEGVASAPDTEIDQVDKRAVEGLHALMRSDAPLLYGPAQLAAAALRSGFKARNIKMPNLIQRLARKADAQPGHGGLSERDADTDPAVLLSAVLDELDRLGVQGARTVSQEEAKAANAAVRGWREMLKTAGGVAGGQGGDGQGDEAERQAKRVAKKAARAAAKAKQEEELLGMPQPQQ